MSRFTSAVTEQGGQPSRHRRRFGHARPNLQPPLRDLGERLAAAFSLEELRDLAFTAAIEPESVPDDTRQQFALGLARAGWCRGRLGEVLAEAARQRPTRDWTIPALPDPPAEGCEEDPLPRPSVFGDSRQVATFVLLLLAAAAVVAAGVWWAGRPRPMTADFNIAVAAVDVAALDTDAEAIGQMLQQQVVAIVEGQLPDDTTATTAVSGERMPVVGDATAAKRLAEQVNAQLVIYGSAEAAGDTIRYTPRFYVLLDTVQADVGEMQGDASLEAPLSFTLPELLEATPPTGRTAAAAGLLTSFVRALVNVAGDDIPAARRHIDTAVAQTERYVNTYEPFAGREVVYLFASHIARIQAYESPDREAHLAAAQGHVEQALKINPNYGRGAIALGNLQFDRGDLFGARQTYLTAAALPNQPPDALVGVKAAQGLGNVHLRQLIGVQPTPGPCLDEVRRLADAGLAHYSAVIAAAGPEPDTPLRDLAARATFYRGEIHQLCAEVEAAALDYAAALEFDTGPPLVDEIATMQATLPRQEE
mgnify:CR=1 FL=1